MFMCISHVHKYRVGVEIGQAGKYPGPRICDGLEMAPYADKVATVGGTHMHRRTRRGAEDPSAWKISGQTLFSGQAQVARKS